MGILVPIFSRIFDALWELVGVDLVIPPTVTLTHRAQSGQVVRLVVVLLERILKKRIRRKGRFHVISASPS